MITALANLLKTPAFRSMASVPQQRYSSVTIEELVKNMSGVAITPDSALQSTVVWACVKVISESIASLPLAEYERLGAGGRKRVSDKPVAILFNGYVNEIYHQTAFEFIEMLVVHLLLRGNFYAYKKFLTGNPFVVKELVPLDPDGVCPVLVKTSDNKMFIRYDVRLPDGREVNLLPSEIVHVRGMSLDGIVGVSPIAYNAMTVESDIIERKYGLNYWKNEARPGMYLETEKRLSDRRDGKAIENLKESWNDLHQGAENTNKIAILEDGMKLHTVDINHKDAQFLELRGSTLTDICRIFRVSPTKVMDFSRATFSNIEHLGIEFITDTLMPPIKRIEGVFNLSLITSRDKYFVEFVTDAYLRGDTATRYEAYKKGREGGWFSRNDIRRMENMNPIDGGDDYLTPMNFNTLGDDSQVMQASAILPAPQADGKHDGIISACAERIARKERMAISKAMNRCEYDEYLEFIDGFYGSHEKFIGSVTGSTGWTEYKDARHEAAKTLFGAPDDIINDHEKASYDGVIDKLKGAE